MCMDMIATRAGAAPATSSPRCSPSGAAAGEAGNRGERAQGPVPPARLSRTPPSSTARAHRPGGRPTSRSRTGASRASRRSARPSCRRDRTSRCRRRSRDRLRRQVPDPGLVDCHAHIGAPFHAKNGPMPSADYVYKLWLAHGVTTVRETGCFNGLTWTLEQKEAVARAAGSTLRGFLPSPVPGDRPTTSTACIRRSEARSLARRQ